MTEQLMADVIGLGLLGSGHVQVLDGRPEVKVTAVADIRAEKVDEVSGQAWRANLHECGDETSHPHWASWAPLDEMNFHLPRCFGTIQFEPIP